jgi:hypothetical protein
MTGNKVNQGTWIGPLAKIIYDYEHHRPEFRAAARQGHGCEVIAAAMYQEQWLHLCAYI